MGPRVGVVGRVLVAAALAALGAVLTAPPAGAIVGGEDADPASSGFVARIDIVRTATSTYTCSGSLVAPRLVLTAAHCLYSRRVEDWTVTFAGPDPQTRDVVALVPYSADAGARGGDSNDDLAIVQLDRAVDRAPVGQDESRRALRPGAPVVELGHGATRPNGIVDRDVPLRRAGQVVTDAGSTRVQAVPSAAGDVRPGSCANGDSGGPLVRDGERPVLLAVTSTGVRGTTTCIFTRVDAASPYRAWLDRFLTAPGSGNEEPTTARPAAPPEPTATPAPTAAPPSTTVRPATSPADATTPEPTTPEPTTPAPMPAPAAPPGLSAGELGVLAGTAAGRLATATPAAPPGPPPVPIVLVFTPA